MFRYVGRSWGPRSQTALLALALLIGAAGAFSLGGTPMAGGTCAVTASSTHTIDPSVGGTAWSQRLGLLEDERAESQPSDIPQRQRSAHRPLAALTATVFRCGSDRAGPTQLGARLLGLTGTPANAPPRS